MTVFLKTARCGSDSHFALKTQTHTWRCAGAAMSAILLALSLLLPHGLSFGATGTSGIQDPLSTSSPHLTIVPNSEFGMNPCEHPDRYGAYQILVGEIGAQGVITGASWGADVDPAKLIAALKISSETVKSPETIASLFSTFCTRMLGYSSVDEAAERFTAQNLAQFLSAYGTQGSEVLYPSTSPYTNSAFAEAFSRTLARSQDALKGNPTASRAYTSDGTAVTGPDAEKTGVAWGFGGLSQGYYLVTDRLSPTYPNGTSHTENMLQTVDSDGTMAYSKASAPTLDKDIIDVTGSRSTNASVIPADGEATDPRDADSVASGDVVRFMLSASLAENIGSYDAYKLIFRDTLGADLEIDPSSVEVWASKGGKLLPGYDDPPSSGTHAGKVTSGFEVSASGRSLAVTIDDIKKLNVEVDGHGWVFVTYSAKILESAGADSGASPKDGLKNKATLDYSSNPYVDSEMRSTPEDHTQLYTYGLNLVKTGKDYTGHSSLSDPNYLANAGFSLYKAQNLGSHADKTVSGMIASFTKDASGCYVFAGWNTPRFSSGTTLVESYNGEGSDSETVYFQMLKTDASGSLKMRGLDEGFFTVSETLTSEGYDPAIDYTFQINATESMTGSTVVFSKASSINNITGIGMNDEAHWSAADDAAHANQAGFDGIDGNGIVDFDVQNVKAADLPSTGAAGIVGFYLTGGILLAIAGCYGVCRLIRKTRTGSAD